MYQSQVRSDHPARLLPVSSVFCQGAVAQSESERPAALERVRGAQSKAAKAEAIRVLLAAESEQCRSRDAQGGFCAAVQAGGVEKIRGAHPGARRHSQGGTGGPAKLAGGVSVRA